MKTQRRENEEVTLPSGAKIDKIKRYEWKVIDRKGEYYDINKVDLYVDLAYQRSKWNQKKVNDIAAAWSWVKCGTLTVAIREDVWWVVDGATRKLAADKRSDITQLPCMVYDLDNSIPDEALSFVGINNSKTVVGSCDRFKALIVGGENSAVGLNNLFQSTGHKASVRGGVKSIACLMTIWKLYQKDTRILTDLWPLISAINEECRIRDNVARALFWTEVAARKQGMTLTSPPFRPFLIKAGGDKIASEVKHEVAIVGRGGARIEANGLIKFMARKRMKGKEKIKIIE